MKSGANTKNMFAALHESDSDDESSKKPVFPPKLQSKDENKDQSEIGVSIFSNPKKSKKNKKKQQNGKKKSVNTEKEQTKDQNEETAPINTTVDQNEDKKDTNENEIEKPQNDLLNNLSVQNKVELPKIVEEEVKQVKLAESPEKKKEVTKAFKNEPLNPSLLDEISNTKQGKFGNGEILKVVDQEEKKTLVEHKKSLNDETSNPKKFDPFVPISNPTAKLSEDLNLGRSISLKEEWVNPHPFQQSQRPTDGYQKTMNNNYVKNENPENKWVNEKKDFFEYLKYLLFEDSVFSYKEISWLRRVLCKFCNLEAPMNKKGKPISIFFKKDLIYDGSMGLPITSIDESDEEIYFTGFVKGNGPKKELFYGRIYMNSHYEVTLYQGAFKEKGNISGKNLRVYSPTGVLEWEGDI